MFTVPELAFVSLYNAYPVPCEHTLSPLSKVKGHMVAQMEYEFQSSEFQSSALEKNKRNFSFFFFLIGLQTKIKSSLCLGKDFAFHK